MSGARSAPRKRRPRRDRWGCRGVRRGWLRGQIRNIRRGSEVSHYGSSLVFEFDLFVDDNLPLVPVRMIGTDFPLEPREGQIWDVPDPTPDIRPIAAVRLVSPFDSDIALKAFYPGRGDPSRLRQRIEGTFIIIGPIAAAAAMVGLFYAIFG